jgi:hypothetical protein
MKKEWKDHSGRPVVWLSDDANEFDGFASQMTSRFGAPTERLDGLDQRYWDFSVGQVTMVLHGDAMAGISLHVEDGTQDEQLRSIGGWLLKTKT